MFTVLLLHLKLQLFVKTLEMYLLCKLRIGQAPVLFSGLTQQLYFHITTYLTNEVRPEKVSI